MIKGHTYLCVLFTLIFSEAFGQNISFPEQTILFPFTYSVYNPSAAGLDGMSQARLLSSFYTGLAENLGMYTAEADLAIGRKHTPGLLIFAEQETEILRRASFYLRYAHHIQLKENMYLSGGLALGIFNYFVRATPSSAGNSVFAPDGNLGLWLNSESFNAGAALGQIFSASITPINSTIRLNRYLTLNGDRKFSLNERINMTAALKVFYLNKKQKSLETALVFTFYDNFMAGALFSPGQSAGFTVGLTQIDMLNVKSDLYFAFSQPIASINPFNSSRFEIMGRIYLDGKE